MPGRDGLDVELRVDLGGGGAERQSTELETALYRITQEALTNARKHGAASRALINIEASEHCMQVTVCDDGRRLRPRRQDQRIRTAQHAGTRRTPRRSAQNQLRTRPRHRDHREPPHPPSQRQRASLGDRSHLPPTLSCVRIADRTNHGSSRANRHCGLRRRHDPGRASGRSGRSEPVDLAGGNAASTHEHRSRRRPAKDRGTPTVVDRSGVAP